MDVRVGETVLVDVGAFTGSSVRQSESVPCEVLAVNQGRILVRTQPPYRVFEMWTSAEWVRLEQTAELVLS